MPCLAAACGPAAGHVKFVNLVLWLRLIKLIMTVNLVDVHALHEQESCQRAKHGGKSLERLAYLEAVDLLKVRKQAVPREQSLCASPRSLHTL